MPVTAEDTCIAMTVRDDGLTAELALRCQAELQIATAMVVCQHAGS
jgi:hypothetical protein